MEKDTLSESQRRYASSEVHRQFRWHSVAGWVIICVCLGLLALHIFGHEMGIPFRIPPAVTVLVCVSLGYWLWRREALANLAQRHVKKLEVLCDVCGYDLSALVSRGDGQEGHTLLCPECGKHFDPAKADHVWKSRLDETSDVKPTKANGTDKS